MGLIITVVTMLIWQFGTKTIDMPGFWIFAISAITATTLSFLIWVGTMEFKKSDNKPEIINRILIIAGIYLLAVFLTDGADIMYEIRTLFDSTIVKVMSPSLFYYLFIVDGDKYM